MSVYKCKKAGILWALVVAGLAVGLPGGTQGAAPAAPRASPAQVMPPQNAADDAVDPNIGFYAPDKRLVGAPISGDELDAMRKARAKAFARMQAAASIEASLKRLMESTDEKAEREALADIERAVRRYQDAVWLIDALWIERECVPYPADKE